VQINDKEEIINELSGLIIEAVKKRTENKKLIGIAFSGGIDSTLLAFICHKLNKNFKLYCVGLENSQDLEHAKKIADEFGWNIEKRVLDLNEAGSIIKNAVKILDSDDVVWIGVGSVTYSVLQMAKKDNVDILLNGLGSEEIFAGYERHKLRIDFNDVNEECWRGLKNLWGRDMKRDSKIASEFGINVKCPFLDEEVIRFAMRVPENLKINKETNKIILREVAFRIGLKEEFTLRKKKAAQYGSNFDKAILKLAKTEGFKTKKDYLFSLKNEKET
ncbi:asparagine synthase, partial [Candidatus Woesearchaeota archaeon]|nr:asparagine synthase [Candidatus Woesearchaeota archaeon]